MTPPGKRFTTTPVEVAFAERHFDFLVPSSKRLLTTPEVGAILRREVDFVRELVDLGKLEAFQDSAFGTRLSNRITRRSVVVHLARTATGATDDFTPGLIEAAKTLPQAARQQLITSLLGGCSPADLAEINRTISKLTRKPL